MEEFRRVHRKMFSTFSTEDENEKEEKEESEIQKQNFAFKREMINNKNEEKKEIVETKPASVEEKPVSQGIIGFLSILIISQCVRNIEF